MASRGEGNVIVLQIRTSAVWQRVWLYLEKDDWSFVPNTKDWRCFIESTLDGNNPEKQSQKAQRWFIALWCRGCKESSLTLLTLFEVHCCTAVSISERLNLGCWHFELFRDCQVSGGFVLLKASPVIGCSGNECCPLLKTLMLCNRHQEKRKFMHSNNLSDLAFDYRNIMFKLLWQRFPVSHMWILRPKKIFFSLYLWWRSNKKYHVLLSVSYFKRSD